MIKKKKKKELKETVGQNEVSKTTNLQNVSTHFDASFLLSLHKFPFDIQYSQLPPSTSVSYNARAVTFDLSTVSGKYFMASLLERGGPDSLGFRFVCL